MHEAIDGVGTDIIEIRRIKEAIARHGNRFIDRLFTAKEQSYCSQYQDAIPRYAGRFAAKEAIVKALGTGLKDIAWLEIEIINDTLGKPEVHLSQRLSALLPQTQILVSISHCEEYATATALLVGVRNGTS